MHTHALHHAPFTHLLPLTSVFSMPLHCTRREMALWLTYALETFWSPLTSASARMLLRYVLALKCGSFALGALQLRSGYPPAAASSGMGRGTFWFMRHVNSSACGMGVG